MVGSETYSLVFTASANICNVVLMRHSELSEGVVVFDDEGNVVGTSKKAARLVNIISGVHICNYVSID